MKQKILTYFYGLNNDELCHSIEKNIQAQVDDGWIAKSISQSIYPTKKKNAQGETMDFNELAVSVLYEKE
jgi:hypothetical protein